LSGVWLLARVVLHKPRLQVFATSPLSSTGRLCSNSQTAQYFGTPINGRVSLLENITWRAVLFLELVTGFLARITDLFLRTLVVRYGSSIRCHLPSKHETVFYRDLGIAHVYTQSLETQPAWRGSVTSPLRRLCIFFAMLAPFPRRHVLIMNEASPDAGVCMAGLSVLLVPESSIMLGDHALSTYSAERGAHDTRK
jgi:hypothetical protein